jgi:hypothetical protein
MVRPICVELVGGLYQFISRDDRREDIYLDEDDRLAWLQLLGEVCDRFNWRYYEFCQMTNYHLGVHDATVSRMIRKREPDVRL